MYTHVAFVEVAAPLHNGSSTDDAILDGTAACTYKVAQRGASGWIESV